MAYSLSPPRGMQGMMTLHDGSVLTRTPTVDGLLPGLFVVRGASSATNNVTVKAPTSAAEVNNLGVGFVVLDTGRDPNNATSTGGYKAKQPIPVMARGFMWVNCETSFVRGTPVFVRFTGTGNAGDVRNDADTANAAKLYNARFAETGSAGLALIWFDNLSPTLGA